MPIDPQNRALFEKIGLEVMRIDFPMGTVIPDGPARGQALEWIAEQEAKQRRRDTCRFWAILIFTIIAAVAACIAAWPILRS